MTEAPETVPDSLDLARGPGAVMLVTDGRGREYFRSAGRLFRRLNEIAATPGVHILALWQGDDCLKPASVGALNAMLRTVGLSNFIWAASRRSGSERRPLSRWGWAFMAEFLGWEWQRN